MKEFTHGFILQASLILALGAQNIFVLESGLKKQRHLLVSLVCSICDALLIAIGVMGAATLFVQIPILKMGFGLAGVVFLLYYGVLKIVEGIKSKHESFKGQIDQSRKTAKEVVILSLGFSLLNPHVYLDTIVLIGGYSAKYESLFDRALFGLGAAFFSGLWFFSLGSFASKMSRFLNNHRSMKIIQFISGTILIFLSWRLGLDVYGWTIT